MAKGRELKGRIKSVENTRKITRTMEMVATSQDEAGARTAWSRRVRTRARSPTCIASLYSPDLAERFPLLRQPATRSARGRDPAHVEPRPRGAFNANLIKEARARIAELEAARHRGRAARRRQEGHRLLPLRRPRHRRPSAPTSATARPRPTRPRSSTRSWRASSPATSTRVYVVYAQFKSALSTPPTTEQVLPVAPPGDAGRAARLPALPVGRGDPRPSCSRRTCATRSTARSSRPSPASRARAARP